MDRGWMNGCLDRQLYRRADRCWFQPPVGTHSDCGGRTLRRPCWANLAKAWDSEGGRMSSLLGGDQLHAAPS